MFPKSGVDDLGNRNLVDHCFVSDPICVSNVRPESIQSIVKVADSRPIASVSLVSWHGLLLG